MRKPGARRNQRLSPGKESNLRDVLGCVESRPQHLNIELLIYPAKPGKIIETKCKWTAYMILAALREVNLGERARS
jgi:hypothetical protein